MKFKKLAVVFLSIFACFSLTACDFSFGTTSKKITVSGNTTFLDSPLENVTIKSNIKQLAKTDANGNFNFTVNADSIEIFAEKEGYVFSPRKIKITDNNSNLKFTAEKVKPLNGDIVLKKINITPTSIATVPDCYKFVDNNKDCMKMKDLYLKVGSIIYNINSDGTYLAKNENNEIFVNDEFSISTNQKFAIVFKLSAYFTAYGHEYNFTEQRNTSLNVQQEKTTLMLNDNGELVLSLYGIISSNNMFSYDISFTFNYFPNI